MKRGERFSHLVSLELRGAIVARNWTVKDVAERIGIHYTGLYRYFSGTRSLPTDVFAGACEVIGADPTDLVGRAYARFTAELIPYQPVAAEVEAGAEQDLDLP